jgi:hypothetical protein
MAESGGSRVWKSNVMVMLVVECTECPPTLVVGGGRPARRECDFKQWKPRRTLFFLSKAPCTPVEVRVLKSHSHITSNKTGTLPGIYTSTLINANSAATLWPNNGTNRLKSLTGCWCLIFIWFRLVCSDTTARKKFALWAEGSYSRNGKGWPIY